MKNIYTKIYLSPSPFSVLLSNSLSITKYASERNKTGIMVCSFPSQSKKAALAVDTFPRDRAADGVSRQGALRPLSPALRGV